MSEADYVHHHGDVVRWGEEHVSSFIAQHGGVVNVVPVHCPPVQGAVQQLASGAWIEVTSDGNTTRYRWGDGKIGTHERAFTRSFYYAEEPPWEAFTWPHERKPREHRKAPGELTYSEAMTVPCDRHRGSMLGECGCRGMAAELATDFDFSTGGPQHQSAGTNRPPVEEPPQAEAAGAAMGGSAPAVEALAFYAWEVRCGGDNCSHHRLVQRRRPPEPVCPDCGDELELERWPSMPISPKARECLDKCDGVVRLVRRKAKGIPCEVCLQPGWEKGNRYFSRGEDDKRRIHALCLEVAARS